VKRIPVRSHQKPTKGKVGCVLGVGHVGTESGGKFAKNQKLQKSEAGGLRVPEEI